MTYKTLLCFDFGTKRIGVAVGQSITNTATPLEIVKVKNNKPDWDQIKKLINEWNPDALVVGLPLDVDDIAIKINKSAKRFIGQLEDRFQLPVFSMDERMSTFEARSRKQDSKSIDHIAAQVILETWFAENNKSIVQG